MIHVLFSEGKKSLNTVYGEGKTCVSHSPFLKRLHWNSFLVFSGFKLTGMPVNCPVAAPPLVLQRGSGPIMKASLQGVCP